MKHKKLLKILSKYCKEIRNGNHYICRPLKGDEVIVVSKTASDRNYLKSVRRDFKRVGIIIKELEL
jgi:hypothetical protein